jgi:HlyD family secretion protein
MAMWELTARQARLEAERDGAETVEFPQDLLQASSAAEIKRIVRGESRLFELRRDALKGQKAQLQERIAQLRTQSTGLTEQQSAKSTEIDLIQQELAGVRELWQKNLVPVTRLTALERDVARVTGERGSFVAAIAQSKEKISETELQIIQLDQNLRSDVAKELAEIRAKHDELVQRRIAALDQLERVEVRAPQKGVVHQLAVHAKGAVITPGEQIMLIVPDTDKLVAEVRISPQSIDQVELNQPVVLRFPSFNQRSTPEINGTVKLIAADVTENQRTGNSYYVVQIAMPAEQIDRLHGLRMVPGMPVDAFMRTDERTVVSYLLKPLLDQARHAFREK